MPDPMAEIGERVKQRTEEDLSTLATIVYEYNPSLRLRRVPDRLRETLQERQYPFVICQVIAEDGTAIPVMWLTEQEVANPPHVLERLFLSDTKKQRKGAILARIEAHEAAELAWRLKKIDEEHERKMDIVNHLFKTPLHTYRLGKGRKMDLQTGVIDDGDA